MEDKELLETAAENGHHGHEHHDHTHEKHHHHDDGHECRDPDCADPSHHHHQQDHARRHHGGQVEISHHEGAVIGALSGILRIEDSAKAEEALSAQMQEAGRRVTEAGGIIGHIKFLLTTGESCVRISVTDETVDTRRFENKASKLEGVAIVFAVEEDLLVKILDETVGSLLLKE